MTALGTDLGAARSALTSACGDVADATEADAVDGVQPALVARPASTPEVAEVLRAAAAHGLAVVPRGRGTKLTWGRPPERADLVVDLSRLAAVLDHAAGDLIVEAQAGTPLADVQRTVAAAGQRLALDGTVEGATVGGTLATNASGPSRVGVGTARDLLIGVTVVRADGVVARAGGRVVKNVAGYDLGKLVIGSFGTLAVVTEAVFRLHPLPAARRVVTAPFDRPEEAQRLVQQVVQAQVVPSAVEVDWPAGGPGSVSVLLEGIEAGVEGRTATTRQLLGPDAAASPDPPAGWARYPWADGPGRPTALKATFALSGLARVLATARSAAADAGTAIDLRGSGGAGVLYGALPADADAAAVAAVVERLRAVCTRAGGALVVLDAPPQVEAAVDTWGPVPALDLMRRVKERFDPERRLAPGRFVGGL
ncbi:FAD-binding oxidoreductase [Geodermatophilus sp. TF02-6]|uniref:FAD-binding oxidoreductase n=1 Tax=Geodermatophilus sp. TF02-6 TaxID=2250575 RepID=UPI000DEA4AA9|nr:FAD-binding oxidoreductase [Geodermatophilus sp. TF02-6]RBY81714.1 FAD-binding oxidoreductase [Geodermatophilus sp. TF02-6]